MRGLCSVVGLGLVLLLALSGSAEGRRGLPPKAINGIVAGSLLQVWKCTGASNQQFVKQSTNTPNVVNIVLQANGMCIDVAKANRKVGAAVWAWACEPDTKPSNERWTLKPDGTITTMLDGYCMTVSGDGNLGSTIVVQPCGSSKNQKFTYNSASKTFTTSNGLCMDVGSLYTCDQPPLKAYPFCNHTLPVTDRVKDLVSRMTPAQMYSQMGHMAPAIPTLGIPSYNWWTECLHGVLSHCGERCPTSFPAPSCMGASFNMSLIHEVAQAISTEARALHNQGIGGLDFWAPNININRDPRWGRNQEVPGEDPYHTGMYVTNFMRGLQEGPDPHYVKVVGTCKHYAAYSLEDWIGFNRVSFNAIISDYDLVDTYLPAWEACILQGRARSIMCSYNAVNGIPSCANRFLLQTILRDQFYFDGYVVSDCDAVECIQDNHHYTNNPASTCGVAMNAGTDLNCGTFYQDHLGQAVGNGTVTLSQIQKAVSRLFKQRFELGMWDPLALQPYTHIPPTAVDTPAHSFLALRAARESMILLKNANKLLPLSKSAVRRVAVIGPNANVTDTLLSDYFGKRCLDGTYDCVTTPLNAIRKIVPNAVVSYAKGCSVLGNDTSGFSAAVNALRNSDVGIVYLGLNQTVETEGLDRYTIDLPGMQLPLIKTLAAVGKPLVVVLINGAAVAIEWVKDNIPAIIEAGYPGENGAQAIAEVIFGDYNPGGKLAYTVYPAAFVNQVPLTNMSMRAAVNNPGRTYRYYTGNPLYEFGHGLSYTTFQVTWVSNLEEELKASIIEPMTGLSFRVNVKNTGSVAGDEVVFAFLTRNNTDNGPLKQLFGFQRVHLSPGESKQLFFSMTPNTLSVPSPLHLARRIIYPGSYGIEIGVGEGKLVHHFKVEGEPTPL